MAEALLGEGVSATVAAAITQVTDPRQRERTARFFGRVEAVVEARGAQRSSEAPREARSTSDLAERAVMLRARFRDDPTAGPDLAAMLLRVAELHDGLGQRRDAFAATEEATRIYRELAAAQPDRYRPNLASALNNLGITLSELGQAHDAHAPAEEATRIYRELAAAEPDRYRRRLASTLGLFAACLDTLGRVDDAKNIRHEREQLLVDLIRGE